MNPTEELKLDLARLIHNTTWEKSYLTTEELAQILFEGRADASRIAELINELEKQDGHNKVESN